MSISKIWALIIIIILWSKMGAGEVIYNKEIIVISPIPINKWVPALLQYMLYVLSWILVIFFICITVCIVFYCIFYGVIQLYYKIKGFICFESRRNGLLEEIQLEPIL
ncbi:hypothetical protein FQR65_LT13515 [Abscondita terminalis]|nr:hypothetical protein FQR65_LT13515 [Abscondita terminalis]